MSKRTLSIMCVVATVLGVFLYKETLQAQKLKGKSRPAPTRQLMKGILQPNAGGLGAALKDAGPADDKAWEAAQTAAIVLNEAGYILMDDGRSPDPVWEGAAKALQEGSVAAMAALEKKDLEGSRAAAKTLMGSCMAYHKAHKPPKHIDGTSFPAGHFLGQNGWHPARGDGGRGATAVVERHGHRIMRVIPSPSTLSCLRSV